MEPTNQANAEPTSRLAGWLWRPAIIVFLSSACIMVLELVAGRIIAPHVGVSLYTWTSVIGVVLAGISLGNYIGGRLADRCPPAQGRRLLGLIFVISGLAAPFATCAMTRTPWPSSVSRPMMSLGFVSRSL